MMREYLLDPGAQFQYLLSLYAYVGRLALDSTPRLVDHYTGVRQRESLAGTASG